MGDIANTSVIRPDNSLATARDVRIGAVVKAVFVEMWLLADGNQLGSFTFTVEKVPANAAAMTASDGADLNGYNNKRNILFTSQGLNPDMNANPIPVVRQWIKIPKGKQRFGQGDNLIINTLANLEGVSFCGVVIFKEYF